MRILRRIIYVIAWGVFVAGSYRASGVTAPPDKGDDGWIEGKLATMSLREKLGQMLMVDVPGTGLTPELAHHLRLGTFGSVVFFERNVVDPDQTRLFIRQLQDLAVVSTGVPMLVAVDQEGGPVNRLGDLLGLKGARHSARIIGNVYQYAPSRARKTFGAMTAQLARRMRHLGFNMNLAPVLDLTDDRSSYIYERSFGGDPAVVVAIAAQFASVMATHGVITTGKHFPNLSVTRSDSHHELPILDRPLPELFKHELVPFLRLKDKLGAIMVGHVVVPHIDPKHPASVSVRSGKLLRDHVGWKGVVISDDIKMKALSSRYELPEILIRSIYAGNDMIIVAWGEARQRQALEILEMAVRRGRISEARIDESVRRILILKEQYVRPSL